MSEALDTVKLVWDIFKDGAKLATSGTTVNAIPKESSVQDLSGWKGPVSYPEKYQELSFCRIACAPAGNMDAG